MQVLERTDNKTRKKGKGGVGGGQKLFKERKKKRKKVQCTSHMTKPSQQFPE